MKLIIFLCLIPFFSSNKFLQLFDTLESETSNPNGYHPSDPETTSSINSPPSLIDYLKQSNDSYSFKQIPDDIPHLSITVPENDDYLKDSFTESSVNVNLDVLENQAENLINEEDDKKEKPSEIEMGKALEKTRDFIEKALQKDLNVGVSKDDLMNLLSFSNKILDKCNGDFTNCKIERKSDDFTSNEAVVKNSIDQSLSKTDIKSNEDYSKSSIIKNPEELEQNSENSEEDNIKNSIEEELKNPNEKEISKEIDSVHSKKNRLHNKKKHKESKEKSS